MLPNSIIYHVEKLISEEINRFSPVSGGDINEVYLLTTSKRKLIIKINSASQFPKMFEAEAQGLEVLKIANVFTIPDVIGVGEVGDTSFLLLQYIESKPRCSDFWAVFGEKLALLHQNSVPYFGFEADNYIGSLSQKNEKYNNAADFYIEQRLQPQFEMASLRGFSFSTLDRFCKNIVQEIPKELSSLVHGDLWSGNFIVGNQGEPCLIDPAVAYAPREMDIGMMTLFGGFDSRVFGVYNEVFPLLGNWKDRLPIWQLYYLLVHLNIFGSSYYNNVQHIVKRYS